ncbi:MAG: type II secretion system F family protein [Chloroflexota bacterium]
MPTIVIWIGGFVIFLLLAAGAIVTITSERSLVEERVGRFADESNYEELEFGSSEDFAQDDQPSILTQWVDNLVNRTSSGERIANMLARADLKFRPGEYVALIAISAIATGAAGYFFGGGSARPAAAIVFAIAGSVLGLFLPRMYVKAQQAKRLKIFSEQLSDMLNLVVNGLRAGYSTMQALEAVSKEMQPPISGEFRRVVQEMQLGVPMDLAFDHLLTRIPSEDLDLVITAINVQREVGGNLSEILETISHTIRERVRIKGEIKTLTAQVVYSGRFLSLMPVILSFILYVINPDYILEFFKQPGQIVGIIILVCSGIMIIVGYLIMQKIADIEV